MKLDYWVSISVKELDELWRLAEDSLERDLDNSIKAARHLINSVLFQQLIRLRCAIDIGQITVDNAISKMRSDFGHGYLFGLVACYVNYAKVNHDSHECKAVTHDVYYFTFGPERGESEVRYQSSRSLESFDDTFNEGMIAAKHDVDSAVRFYNGNVDAQSQALLDGIVALCLPRRKPHRQ